MRQFYLAYHGHEKLQPLVGEISWAKHLIILGKRKDSLEREFYIRMTKKFGWSKNVLTHQIENQSYAKTLLGQALAQRPQRAVAAAGRDRQASGGWRMSRAWEYRRRIEIIQKVGKRKGPIRSTPPAPLVCAAACCINFLLMYSYISPLGSRQRVIFINNAGVSVT